MLQRSIIQPITGTIRALTMPPTESANEAVRRCQPISAMIGFRKTPKVKARTGPLQTNKPVTAPPTTHQGLLNRMPKMSSRDAAGFDARVGGHPIASRSAGPMAHAKIRNALSDGITNRKSAFPAKAGIHLSGDGAAEKWVPAFAGNANFFG